MEKKSLTFSMISFNDEAIIEDCLSSIRSQDYDQKLIHILLVDGGSTDNTIVIAKRYGADVIFRPDLKDRPDVRGGLALTEPTTDLILCFSADNRFQEQDALSKMVEVLLDEDIVGCETLRYGYRRSDPLLCRYFALIGGIDPIAIGLGKADRGPFDCDGWRSFGDSIDCGGYYKVKFARDISKIPTMGANGFLVRSKLVQESKFARSAAHVDICAELIFRGHDKFAFVKNKHIIHFIDIGISAFVKRKLIFTEIYSSENIERMYSVFHPNDVFKLIFIILCYPTFVVPFLRSLKGYRKVRDIAWFLHPFMCCILMMSYSFYFLKNLVQGRIVLVKKS